MRLLFLALVLLLAPVPHTDAATDLTNRLLFIVPGGDDSPPDEFKPIPTQFICSAMYWIWLNDVTGGAKGFSRTAVKSAFNMPTTGGANENQGAALDTLLDLIVGPNGAPFTFAQFNQRKREFLEIIGNWNAKEDFTLTAFDTADEIEAHFLAIGDHL